MGGIGIVIAFIWLKVIYSPEKHPRLNSAEFKYLQDHGAITNMGENQLKKVDENNKMSGLISVNYWHLGCYWVFLLHSIVLPASPISF